MKLELFNDVDVLIIELQVGVKFEELMSASR
jgi:hypothetical protein